MSISDRGEGRALVVVPTYNEAENISDVVKRLFDAVDGVADLLVVDDGSPDGTADIVRRLAQSQDGLHLLERPEKRGLGTAYVDGFKWGIERGYWAVVEMDGDLSHDPADVPRLLTALDDADLAIGSRYIRGGTIRNWGTIRRSLSLAANVYARLWLGFPIKDSTSGFRAYRTQILSGAALEDIRCEGYAFQIEMARHIYRRGGRIVEMPIAFTERRGGKSKISRRIVFEALGSVARWGLSDRFGRGRKSPVR